MVEQLADEIKALFGQKCDVRISDEDDGPIIIVTVNHRTFELHCLGGKILLHISPYNGEVYTTKALLLDRLRSLAEGTVYVSIRLDFLSSEDSKKLQYLNEMFFKARQDLEDELNYHLFQRDLHDDFYGS